MVSCVRHAVHSVCLVQHCASTRKPLLRCHDVLRQASNEMIGSGRIDFGANRAHPSCVSEHVRKHACRVPLFSVGASLFQLRIFDPRYLEGLPRTNARYSSQLLACIVGDRHIFVAVRTLITCSPKAVACLLTSRVSYLGVRPSSLYLYTIARIAAGPRFLRIQQSSIRCIDE